MKASVKNTVKEKVQNSIYARAYEIEQELSKDNYHLAKLAGIKPENISSVSLNCAIKELKKQFS